MTSVIPYLMFEGRAEEAMRRYVAVLPDASVERLDLTPEGKVAHGEVTVAGQRLRFFDSPAPHAFTFTPALSLFLTVEQPQDVDRIAADLGSEFLMPVGDYGFSTRFAWFNDEFGVSWQVNAE